MVVTVWVAFPDLEEGETSPVAEMSMVLMLASLRFLEAEPALPFADAAAGLRARTSGLPVFDEALLLPEPERRRAGGLLGGPEEREGWRDPLGIVLRRLAGYYVK